MTKIQWTEETWNPIAGCSVVSPGCTNCYAMRRMAPRLSHNPATPHYAGTVKKTKGGQEASSAKGARGNGQYVWTGKIGIAADTAFLKPLRTKKPTMFFVNSMSDLFHENVPDEVIDRIFAVMALCPQHTFQVLTKRSKRMRIFMDWFTGGTPHIDRIKDLMWRISERRTDHIHGGWPLPNVWLGVSVEDQARAEERIPDLLATPAAIRFISAEPLLGPVDLIKGLSATGGASLASSPSTAASATPCLDWVIVGGESGKGARPMHPDWARSIRDQCASAGVPFFFKQWGDWEIALDRDYDDPDFRRDYTNDYVDHGKSKWLNLAGGCGFHGERFHVMRKVGTKRAGRLLDGVEHNAMPGGAAIPDDLMSGEIR